MYAIRSYYAGLTSNAYGAFRKYTNWDTRTTEKDSPKNMDSDINVRLIRLADVYLMYAESLIKGGSDESGVSEAFVITSYSIHYTKLYECTRSPDVDLTFIAL